MIKYLIQGLDYVSPIGTQNLYVIKLATKKRKSK